MQDRYISTDVFMRRARFLDIDLQAAQLSGHDQLYRQLSGGTFDGSFTTIEDSTGAGIYVERVNQVIEQAGVVPKGHVSLLFLTGGQQAVRLGGAPFSQGQFSIAGPGQEIEFQTAKDTEVCVLSISRTQFEQWSEGTAYQQIAEGGLATYDNPQATSELCKRVAGLTTAAFARDEATPALPSLSSWMWDVLAGLFDQGGEGCASSPSRRTAARGEIFRAARSMILDRLDRVSVPMLSQQLQVSRRTLEYAFQDMVGISPLTYINTLRLDAIRRDIRRTDEPIGDIAARYGIWHLGRLAASYRAAFGQLPSQARRGF